jgi:hypothetical protein
VEVVRQPAGLPQGVLARGGIDGSRRVDVPHGAVAECPDAVTAFDAERRVDDDAPAVVERQAQFAAERARLHPRCPDERPCGDPRAVRELGDSAVVGGERRPRADVDSASRELVVRVLAEPSRDVAEDRRRRVDENQRCRASRSEGKKCRTASWARSPSSASASTPAYPAPTNT